VAMPIVEGFDQALMRSERRIISQLNTPIRIQAFLDKLPYCVEKGYRCPLRVLREHTADCFDGALFGAAALRRLGNPPLILNMIANNEDDDHILALYKRDGYWGALAKSNFAGLRFREPIYRTLRELVMSYFEQFYNVERKKTLRSYTAPLHLKAFDKFNWMTSDELLDRIENRLDEIRKMPLLTRRLIAGLSLIDERSYRAGLVGTNRAGLYQPDKRAARKPEKF
jgi:hypothetical protein